MKLLSRLALVSLVMFTLSALADVSRQPVRLADLPAPVRKTVMQQKGDAGILRLEKFAQEGNQIYELELRGRGAGKTVLIDATGKVLEVKQPIKLSEVSPAAKAIIESSVGPGTIRTLQSVKIGSGIIAAYEVKFTRDGKQLQLRIGPDGSLVQE